MGIFFGKSKKPQSRVTHQDRAVLQLKQQRDKIKQYQKRIEQSLESDRQLAKKCLQNGRKERAKLLLRKKKYQEQMLKNTDVQLENLEKMAADIEFAQIEVQVVDGLRVGNDALKKVHEVLSIDDIEQILEETREAVDKQSELDALLSGALTTEDEADVERELNELIAIEEELTNPVAEDDSLDERLPSVPSEEPITEKKEKIKERKRVALEAS